MRQARRDHCKLPTNIRQVGELRPVLDREKYRKNQVPVDLEWLRKDICRGANSLIKASGGEKSQTTSIRRIRIRTASCRRGASRVIRRGKEEKAGHLRLRVDKTHLPQEPVPVVLQAEKERPRGTF